MSSLPWLRVGGGGHGERSHRHVDEVGDEHVVVEEHGPAALEVTGAVAERAGDHGQHRRDPLPAHCFR
jgi:hypothetical protein